MIDANVAVAGYPIYKVDLDRGGGPDAGAADVPDHAASAARALHAVQQRDAGPGHHRPALPGIRAHAAARRDHHRLGRQRRSPRWRSSGFCRASCPCRRRPVRRSRCTRFTSARRWAASRAPAAGDAAQRSGAGPGQQAEIWWYDAAPTGGPGAWKLAGMGTVSADGRRSSRTPASASTASAASAASCASSTRILGLDQSESRQSDRGGPGRSRAGSDDRPEDGPGPAGPSARARSTAPTIQSTRSAPSPVSSWGSGRGGRFRSKSSCWKSMRRSGGWFYRVPRGSTSSCSRTAPSSNDAIGASPARC